MMFDRSMMAPAEFEFVVLADTHYMLDPGGRALEFESRRKQTARADAALSSRRLWARTSSCTWATWSRNTPRPGATRRR